MDLRQLEIIRAIAETGSFTAAGEKLHVSQSAISRQILLLEDELGEPVFHRIGRRIRITPAGESLLQLSHRVFSDLQETVSAISDTQEALRGSIGLVGGMTVWNPCGGGLAVTMASGGGCSGGGGGGGSGGLRNTMVVSCMSSRSSSAAPAVAFTAAKITTR